MEDWQSSVGRILTTTAATLERGFAAVPPPPAAPQPAEVHHRAPVLAPKAQRPPAAADQRLSGPPAAAPFPSMAGPAYAQVEMVDMVIGKVVAKVESLREAVKGVHTELDLERHKREMKERELYLNLKAEMNERLAQMTSEWRKSETALRRALMSVEEKQLLIPLGCPPGRSGPPPPADVAELALGFQERWQDRLFELESAVNGVKRAQEERSRRQDTAIAQKVQEEVEHALERLRGVAWDAGRDGAQEQLRVRTSNFEALMEERWHQFQELSEGNRTLVLELGARLAQVQEQMKLDVLGQRETLKRDLDAVQQQQFLLRDWKDGLEGKLRVTNDAWEARMAKVQADIMAAVQAFKQQVVEDERRAEQALRQEVATRNDAVLEKARAAVQGALKDFSVTSASDYSQLQKQVTGLKAQLDDLRATVGASRAETDQRVQDLTADSTAYGQRVNLLLERSGAMHETISLAVEETKKAKRESQALREELVAASEAMGKLGRDVEGHLRGFGKAAKEHARQAKDALAAAKECEAAVAATRDAHQHKLECLKDELDRASTQFKYLTEGQDEARLRLDRVERRVEALGSGTNEMKTVAEDARARAVRLEGLLEEQRHAVVGLQSRPIGMTQAEVLQTLKASKGEIRDFAEQTLVQLTTQFTAKLQVDLHGQLHTDLTGLVAGLAAQQSDTARQVVELQAEAGGTGAAVKALQRRAEAAGEEQARQAAEVRALQAGLAEAQAAGRTDTARLDRLGRELEALQGAVAVLQGRPSGDVRQADLEELQRRFARLVEEAKAALQRAAGERGKALDGRLASLQAALDEERQANAAQWLALRDAPPAAAADTTAAVAALQAKLPDLSRRLDDLQQAATAARRAQDDLRREVADGLAEAQRSRAAAAEDAAALRGRCEGLGRDAEAVRQEVRLAAGDVAALRLASEEANARLAQHQAAAQRDAERVAAEQQQTAARLRQCSATAEAAAGEAKAVRQRLEDVARDGAAAAQEAAAWRQRVAAQEEALPPLVGKVKALGDLKAAVEAVQEAVGKLSKGTQAGPSGSPDAVDLQRTVARLATVEAALGTLEGRLRQWEEGRPATEDQLEDLRAAVQEAEKAAQGVARDWKAAAADARAGHTQLQRTVAAAQAQLEAAQAETARTHAAQVSDTATQVAALRDRLAQESSALRADLHSHSQSCQRLTADCTAALEALRGGMERRLAEQDGALQQLRLAGEGQGRALTAAREEQQAGHERHEKALAQVTSRVTEAAEALAALRAKANADLAELREARDSADQSVGRLAEAQRAAVADLNDRISRRIAAVEAVAAQATEAAAHAGARQAEEQRTAAAAGREAQDRLQARLRASEVEWTQRFASVEALAQQCQADIAAREDALARSFQTLHRDAAEQTARQHEGLSQRLGTLAARLEQLKEDCGGVQLRATVEEQKKQLCAVSVEVQDAQRQLQQHTQQLQRGTEQLQSLSSFGSAAQQLEAEMAEVRECVEAMQQDSQATVENLHELTADVHRCLTGHREVQALRHNLARLQEQADTLLTRRLAQLGSDVAFLRGAYEALQESSGQHASGLQQELSALAQAVLDLRHNPPMLPGGSDTESVGSEGSDRSQPGHAAEGEGEGRGLGAPPHAVRRPSHPRRHQMAPPARMEASLASILEGLEHIKGRLGPSAAGPLPRPEGTAPTLQLIECMQHQLRSFPAASPPRRTPPPAGGPGPEEAGPGASLSDTRVTWAEPLHESWISAVDDSQLNDSQSNEVIETVARELASLRGLVSTTHAGLAPGGAADLPAGGALTPLPAYPSDGESSDGVGTSDRLIAGIQTELSSVAGLLALTYSRVGERQPLGGR